jgi:hypothetical protein
MTGEELEELTERLLINGIPKSVVARSLDLDIELVSAKLRDVRVNEYGTDDMTEYMEQLQWDAVDEARKIIATGSAAEKSRMLGMVLGKQVALSARRTPEGVRNSQGALLDLLEDMRTSKPRRDPPQSRFVAKLEKGSDVA